jgi:hypothetical protein
MKNKITLLISLLFCFAALSQTISTGGGVIGGGAKGEKGDTGTGVSNINEVAVLQASDIVGANKIFSIQGNFTLTANLTFPDNSIIKGDLGKITVSTYTIGGNNLTFDSEYDKPFIDLGQNGSISNTATFASGDINLAWFGLVFDGIKGVYQETVQSGTDNRNVILQAQKIYNSRKSGKPYVDGNGIFMMSATPAPLLARDVPTGMYITGNVHFTFGDNVYLGILPNSLDNYEAFAAFEVKNAKLINPQIIGDLVDHNFVSVSEYCYAITVKGMSDGFQVLGGVLENFSGDGFIARKSFEVTFSSAGGNGIDESVFETINGGLKNTIINTNGSNTTNPDFATSKLFSLSNIRFGWAGQMMFGGHVAFSGISGWNSFNLYVSFFDESGNFIERTGLVERDVPLPLKPEYKQFKVTIYTPKDWNTFEATVYAPQSPKNVIFSPDEVINCVRQGVSNLSPYSKIRNVRFERIGRRYDGTVGSPAYAIDIEDGYALLNNIDINDNYFGNTARGSIILKGTRNINIYNNIFPYPNIAGWDANRTISLRYGYNTSFTGNSVFGHPIDLGRGDSMSSNRLENLTISYTLENEVIEGEINNKNISFLPNSADVGNGFTYFRNNYWKYDKPLDPSVFIFTHRRKANVIRENEIFDFQGNTTSTLNRLSTVINGEAGISQGYVKNVIIKNIKPADGNGAIVWVYQKLEDFSISMGLDIRGGSSQNLKWNNINLEGNLFLTLNDFANTNTGNFNTLEINNLNIEILTAVELNSGVFAFGSTQKDINIIVKDSSFKIKIGTNGNADDFLGLLNNGSKHFINTTFYTDQTGSTQSLNSSYEFTNCTFQNITFTGATIN